MNEFMKTLLSLSVSGTLLLLLILGLKTLYKNRFSKRWQYYIWLLAALRFLLPFTPDTTIVGGLFEKFDAISITEESPAYPDAADTASVDYARTERPQADNHTVTAASQHPFHRYVCLFFVWSAEVLGRLLLHRYDCLFFIWSVTALGLLVRKITVYQGLIQYIRAGNAEVSDIGTLNLLSDCQEKLNLKMRADLYRNALIPSPIMIGFFHPGVVLPDRELEEKELVYIFTHELTHCKQRDMFYKWLIQLVVCVHWFNPFVYLLEKEVNRACELSCDEKVISALDDTGRREYGDMLISFLRADENYRHSPASVTLTEGAEQLKERLGAIMNFKRKTKFIMAVSFMAAVMLSVGGFAIGAYTAQPNVREESAAPAKYTAAHIPYNGANAPTTSAAPAKYTIAQEDGTFYIYWDGADESNQPIGGVTDGSIQFVLVRKDGYASLTGFHDTETLMEDVRNQCDIMWEQGRITDEEKEVITGLAGGRI